jgi:hypothetical protein
VRATCMGCVRWRAIYGSRKECTMKSTAQRIASEATDVADAMTLASKENPTTEQDWDIGATSFIFADGSTLYVSGFDFRAATDGYRIHVRSTNGAEWMPVATGPADVELYPTEGLALAAVEEREALDRAAGEHWEYRVVRTWRQVDERDAACTKAERTDDCAVEAERQAEYDAGHEWRQGGAKAVQA